MKNIIGIEKDKAAALVNSLNSLLANYQVHYQNLRGFHWNIVGPNFFELHTKFEELYTVANESVDQIAERILTLEGQPLHSFSQYLEVAEIKPAVDVSNTEGTVGTTINDLQVLIAKEREIVELASDANDEGTVDLMSDYINQQEKLTWMLSAYMRNQN